VAEVVCDNVEYGEEGVHIDHEESVPFPWGSGGKPTLAKGHLPLKFSPDNSHLAFVMWLPQWIAQEPVQDDGSRPRLAV
jgi:hypothetical protein